MRLPAPGKVPMSPKIGTGLVPSRSGGVLKAAVIRGYMTVSNSVTIACTWASVTTVDAAPRQSPAGKAVSLATHDLDVRADGRAACTA